MTDETEDSPGRGKGKRRSIEEREADLLAQLDLLRKKKRLAALKEAAKSDGVATALLMTIKSIDRSLAIPDVTRDELVVDFLKTVRNQMVEKVKARGIPIEDESFDEDSDD